ncbi:MAG: hypothetical protein FJW31_07085 [Acidobacteria bacterium]|nr:hypothetical protein [Acidobacteriota bacterium]
MAKFAPKGTYDDANLILRLYDMRREERMREARAWFTGNFQPATMEEFQKLCPPGSKENASYRQVTSYWDMAASFVTGGVLTPELFFHSNRELLLVYKRMEKLIPLVREANKDPLTFDNLETVAKEFIVWMNKRAAGSYEAFSERISLEK